ncbi:hypothetical protein M569_12118 [Genlisea aurea]|uniref:Uncharacterized protein n=1 Tax=Genlisea aurea TaxID=192259 RepID=S8CDT7_9LAMI|nr:hypothetical protein M569_12118 [Genlisea aurea]
MKAVYASSVAKWKKYMTDIATIDIEAFRYLQKIPPETWTLSHDGGARCGTLTTNQVEGMNGVVKGARHLPVTVLAQNVKKKLLNNANVTLCSQTNHISYTLIGINLSHMQVSTLLIILNSKSE